MQKTRVNHQIQAPDVRVVTEDGQMLGVMKLSAALNLAGEHGLDLVEVAPNAKPPVTKLIDFDKYKYQQRKAEQLQKKKAKKVEVKTLRLSVRIGQHDMEVKAKQAADFLEEGNLVRIELRMRGREQAFTDLAHEQIRNFQKLITVPYRLEVPTKRMGGTLALIIAPNK